jgi:hypothetical protein
MTLVRYSPPWLIILTNDIAQGFAERGGDGKTFVGYRLVIDTNAKVYSRRNSSPIYAW